MADSLPPSLFDPAPAGTPGGGSGQAAERQVAPARPRPAKAPDALRTIGEVAAALGIRQHVLRYWEEQFPMLRPLKRSGGRRYYRPDDVAMVERIDRLVHKERYTLRGARAVLEGRGGEPAAGAAAPDAHPAPSSPAQAVPLGANALDRLRAIRARLAATVG